LTTQPHSAHLISIEAIVESAREGHPVSESRLTATYALTVPRAMLQKACGGTSFNRAKPTYEEQN